MSYLIETNTTTALLKAEIPVHGKRDNLQMSPSNLPRGPKKRMLREAIANPCSQAQSLECLLEQILR